eukprot:TRINITY_DN4468_c0_g1_i1.p1 TRINITY_DN4468_c0_g1~~TRINITY_DN4468_c0_g1_i1.p1  ORF type:complete len:768 (-),score=240.93 TRINITY_DN4468_c0_g1_i1:594-2897(-)
MNLQYPHIGGLSLHGGGGGGNPYESLNLLETRLLPLEDSAEPPPGPKHALPAWNRAAVSPSVFRCTLNKIPETEGLLKKARLPLGLLLHPFKDLSTLTVVQCPSIVRCRSCRTYINPYVSFIDSRRWKCNVCWRINEVPEEFLYDPGSKSYGDPSRRPELLSSTIEFIAPSEYMLRPPQPAAYLFVLEVSRAAITSGYLEIFTRILREELGRLPGDSRTLVGLLAFDASVHFYALPPGASKPVQMTVSDIHDMFIPSPNDLVVNLNESRSLFEDLLKELPGSFAGNPSTDSALGPALQAAYKILYPTGGRLSVFSAQLPNVGPGALENREKTVKKDSVLLGPANDFYKRLALDCSGQHIAVDIFSVSNSYSDLSTLSGVSRFSGGTARHFPSLRTYPGPFSSFLPRYFSRKIGFEAVMRVRCSRGLSLSAFHGHSFVRSTDLLCLPNVSPDAGFGLTLSLEEDLHDTREVSFQAALLYTSSKGERRIRVHTLCIPTTASLLDVLTGADSEAIAGMLAKFATERAINSSLREAREGLVLSVVDALSAYRSFSGSGGGGGSYASSSSLLVSSSLRLLPLYTLALLKSPAFSEIGGASPDARNEAFVRLRTLPLGELLRMIYPGLYRVDDLMSDPTDGTLSVPGRLQLSYEYVGATGVYLLDRGDEMILYLTRGVNPEVLASLVGVRTLQEINDEQATFLPSLNTPESHRLREFIDILDSSKPFPGSVRIIREDSHSRRHFTERLIEDKFGGNGGFSYFEFLHHIRQQLQ